MSKHWLQINRFITHLSCQTGEEERENIGVDPVQQTGDGIIATQQWWVKIYVRMCSWVQQSWYLQRSYLHRWSASGGCRSWCHGILGLRLSLHLSQGLLVNHQQLATLTANQDHTCKRQSSDETRCQRSELLSRAQYQSNVSELFSDCYRSIINWWGCFTLFCCLWLWFDQ